MEPSTPPHKPKPTQTSRSRLGVTMPELMVVIGIIVVLVAILVPALRAVRGQALMSSSMNNLRQTATFMRAYERDHRDTIVPSQFDYRNEEFTYRGKVRAPEHKGVEVDPATGERHRGTWADILWTVNGVGRFPEAVEHFRHDYSTDAPDDPLYDAISGTINNPFRSEVANTKFGSSTSDPQPPKPYGRGASAKGYPGYFAANDFFDARPPIVPGGKGAPDYLGERAPMTGRWWATGQIRSPERSMYLVDSFFGEVIAPEPEPFDNTPSGAGGARPIEVDFRYAGSALMLMLDGSVRIEGAWQILDDLEEHRSIRIRQLDRRVFDPDL